MLNCMYLLSQNYIYTDEPYLFGGVPQSYLRGLSPGYSPQELPQIKLNSQPTLFSFSS